MVAALRYWGIMRFQFLCAKRKILPSGGIRIALRVTKASDCPRS